jgi:hypothetical protein
MQYGIPLSQIVTAIEVVRASDFAARHSGRIVEMKFLKGENRHDCPGDGGSNRNFPGQE